MELKYQFLDGKLKNFSNNVLRDLLFNLKFQS
jgi:hypothetical protein